MKRFALIVAALALLLGAGQAHAGFIATRSELNTKLGGAAVTEDFEKYSIAAGNAVLLGTTTLSSTTVANGQGPGLVVAGIVISSTGGLQWNGNGYFSLPSKTLSGESSPLTIQFTTATNAFGVDVLAYSGYAYSGTFTVYGTDLTTVLGTETVSVPNAPSSVFLGFSDDAGIGKVTLTDNTHGFTPVIDNLTFGQAPTSAVPEPASLTLLGVGVAGLAGYALRRRKMASK